MAYHQAGCGCGRTHGAVLGKGYAEVADSEGGARDAQQRLVGE